MGTEALPIWVVWALSWAAMSATIRRMALEDSPESFWERFCNFAQTWPVSPEPLGSPLLEVLTPWGPLFVFDRTLTPFSGEAALLILHGQALDWEPAPATPAIEHLGGGRYQVTGRVAQVLDPQYFVLEVDGEKNEGNLQIVVAAANSPSPGMQIRAQLASPLMVFRSDLYSR